MKKLVCAMIVCGWAMSPAFAVEKRAPEFEALDTSAQRQACQRNLLGVFQNSDTACSARANRGESQPSTKSLRSPSLTFTGISF